MRLARLAPVLLMVLGLLWPAAASASPAGQALQAQLNGMLARTVGPGRGFVVVSESANANRTALAQLRYGRTGLALAGTRAAARWTGGVASAGTTAWANDVTITRTTVAPGAIRHLGIALVLDRSIPAAQARGLARAVAAASGLRRARGDTLTLLRTRLPPVAAAPGATAAARWTALARRGAPLGLALVVVGFAAFMAWTITRHRRDDGLTT